MAATTMVHIRLDETLKTQAADTLAAMGLSLSDAVRVFLTRVVAEQRLPFELKAPNAETRAALAEAEAIIRTRNARFTSAEALFDALDQETHRR
ncbi:MAG: type II toxin-antitoxin system RelB/DinJ family antitoxin [Candidatus Competibacter sp.]|nr:type II toxin-antitoxin system RelB/DinJ family antitoxin [Candidatus Competibacter sp.]